MADTTGIKERPILFSGAMVRSLLNCTKSQTRRAVKGLSPDMWIEETASGGFNVCYDGEPSCATGVWDVPEHSRPIMCPYGKPGDRLWVRESGWERPERTPQMMREGADTWAPYYYAADGEDGDQLRAWGFKVRPSIHMPRWACRILLEVVSVRVERLQDISEEDAKAEGITRIGKEYINLGDTLFDKGPNFYTIELDGGNLNRPTAKEAFQGLWESINGPGSWDANPWVWVVEFKREQS